MAKINVLDSYIYNRIAAGEVVQNPSSVVKELIENSIDAGAKNIVIEIKDGGIKQIKITDDGCGIEKDYVKTAFLPHATSKISCVDDLESIQTLGFRGEALSSIAAVSMVTLKTKTINSETGTLIELKSDLITEFSECAMQGGTIFCVDNIFFNTPARAKFLKSKKSEESEITNVVSRFIIANPYISFKYLVDDKLVFDFLGNGLLNALSVIYGKEILDNVIEVKYQKNGYELQGFISKPEFAKANRSYQTLIINDRLITNSLISTAIFNAYGGFLMTRRYPLFALSLKMPYDMLDVNVHPSKLDVRFKENNHIYGIFYNAVFNCLNNLTASQNIFSNNGQSAESVVLPPVLAEPKQSYNSNFNKPKVAFNESDNFEYNLKINEPVNYRVSEPDTSAAKNIKQPVVFKAEQKFDQTVMPVELKQHKIVGTIFNTYIVLQLEEDMLLIDQHAAAERLLYDKLKQSINNKKMAVQTLMLPYILNVNSSDFNFIEQNLPVFKLLGFNIEQFGNNSFKISEVPMFFDGLDFNKFFDNLLSDEVNIKSIKSSDIIKEKLMQAACKASVKAGDSLNNEDIESLINSIKHGVTLLCPHGRPIIVKYSKNEIEKWFKRIV